MGERKTTGRGVRGAAIGLIGAACLAGAAADALAGEVTVTKRGHTVTIRGSADADRIAVGPSETPNSFVVYSLDEGTTVVGTTDVGVTAKDTLVIALGEGGDTAEVYGTLPALRSIKVVGGSGGDTFRFGGGEIRGGVSVSSGEGDDTVELGGSDFKGAVAVRAQGGNDTVRVTGGADFAKGVKIDGGTGDDDVTVGAAGFYATLAVIGGTGNDVIALAQFTVLGTISLSCGTGDDTLSNDGESPADFRWDVVADGGPGADTLRGAFTADRPHRATKKKFETVEP